MLRLGLLFVCLGLTAQTTNDDTAARQAWNDWAIQANVWAKYHLALPQGVYDLKDHKLYHHMLELEKRSNKLWSAKGYK